MEVQRELKHVSVRTSVSVRTALGRPLPPTHSLMHERNTHEREERREENACVSDDDEGDWVRIYDWQKC